jgi:hypothetical protein
LDVIPADDFQSYSGRRRRATACSTVKLVSRIRHVVREYWFELLIAVLGIAAMLELIIGRDSPGAPSTPLWFEVPAVAVLVLPLFARRRIPFAAPAAYWLMATGLSFVDGALIPFMVSLFPVGLVSAFLLGNLRDARRAWIGLAVVLGGITTVVYNIPGHLTAELVFIPVDFGISWAAGFACASVQRRPRRRRSGRSRPNGSARRQHGWPSPKSARGSPGNCTTSSRTP